MTATAAPFPVMPGVTRTGRSGPAAAGAAGAPRDDATACAPPRAAARQRRDASEREAAAALRVQVGRAIRRLREAADYPSQKAFADAAGVHRTYAGKVERGEVNLSLDSLARLAAALGVSPGQVLLEAERDA